MLAADPIIVEIAGEAYELRPTLLAATRLARRHGDFATIYNAILADHISIVSGVIREGSGSPLAAADFLNAVSFGKARRVLDTLRPKLLAYVLALAGHDDEEPETAPPGKPMSFADYHAKLFAIGTGWLGWTPAETWAATPAEILAAQRGRLDLVDDLLGAILGKPKEAPSQSAPDTFDRKAFAALKAKIAAETFDDF